MESVNEIRERLSAKSRTATLDELKSEGRKQVRLIRAEHIAAMVSQAVHAAIEDSGLIDPAEHEQLVEKSRDEFASILQERQQEAKQSREVEERLQDRERELNEAKHRCTELAERLATVRAELEQASEGTESLKSELETARAEAERAREAVAQAEAAAETAAEAAKSQAAPPAPAAPAASPELLMSLFQEMATMKASMQQQAQPAPEAAGGPDIGAALDKITSSLNDRLDSFGKKMGISAAVGGEGPTDFSALFKDAGAQLESNMDNIQVKQKAAGGIAANLARLKKLKGGE